MDLHFLPGFLGLSSDWELFKENFLPHTCIFHSITDYLPDTPSQEFCFSKWAKNFNQSVLNSCDGNKNRKILIGYSLGGRLALHSLFAKSHWHGAIIVSAHPGLASEEEKIARLKNDEAWATRFLEEPWNKVIAEWNAQGVFSSRSPGFSRHEKHYNKNTLARIITDFSLGKQENLSEQISHLKIPLLWLTGELDTKFSSVAKDLAQTNKNLLFASVPYAGHRLPWEEPAQFTKICRQFFSNLMQYCKDDM